jgi:hypothetical protein
MDVKTVKKLYITPIFHLRDGSIVLLWSPFLWLLFLAMFLLFSDIFIWVRFFFVIFALGNALKQGHHHIWVPTWLSPHLSPYFGNVLILLHHHKQKGRTLTLVLHIPANGAPIKSTPKNSLVHLGMPQ